jgi:hypothetical protein
MIPRESPGQMTIPSESTEALHRLLWTKRVKTTAILVISDEKWGHRAGGRWAVKINVSKLTATSYPGHPR